MRLVAETDARGDQGDRFVATDEERLGSLDALAAEELADPTTPRATKRACQMARMNAGLEGEFADR